MSGFKNSAILFFLVANLVIPAAFAQTTNLDFSCSRKVQESIHMLNGFELSLTDTTAELVLNTNKNTRFVGKMATKQNLKTRWIRYIGFDDLLSERKTSLLVSRQIYSGKSGLVRLEGKGEAYENEDYICLLNN